MPHIFLSLNDALSIHADQLAQYGGAAGIRDITLLESALGQPMATYDGEYLHRDIFEMAAAYLFHITKNHPFVDGNKRVGAVSAVVFLHLNGFHLIAPEMEFEQLVWDVASGSADKVTATQFHRTYTNPPINDLTA